MTIDTKELRKRLFYRVDLTLEVQTIEELLDRLEEAEIAQKINDQTIYDLTEKVIPNIQKKLEAAEKELAEIRHGATVANDTIKAQQAKIEAMEKQEPVAHVWRCDNGHIHGSCESELLMGQQLYALPGAQGEEK